MLVSVVTFRTSSRKSLLSNPPHFLPRWDDEVPVDPRDAEAMASVDQFEQASRLKARDPDWSIHRRFYEGVAAHMKPGGHVVMQENAKPFTNGMATEEMFIDMIRAGGGEYVGRRSGQTVSGLDTKMFYMISRW
jgi:methylase of polypeptide subunit release factors